MIDSLWICSFSSGQLAEAGGLITDLAGQALRYNQRETTYAGVVAASRTAFPHVLGWAQASGRLYGGGGLWSNADQAR